MSPGLLSTAAAVASRDVLLALRGKADIANALLFFVIVASLFPLAVGLGVATEAQRQPSHHNNESKRVHLRSPA